MLRGVQMFTYLQTFLFFFGMDEFSAHGEAHA